MSSGTKPKWRERKQRNKSRKPPEAPRGQQKHGTPHGPKTSSTPKKREWWNSFLAWFSILTGFATLIALYFVLVTRLAVYPSATLNPQNPFQTPFIVENQGYLPIYSVHHSATLFDVVDTGNGVVHNVDLHTAGNATERLGPNRKTTVAISQILGWRVPIKQAYASVNVRFKTVIGTTKEESFRFRMGASASGELIWFPVEP